MVAVCMYTLPLHVPHWKHPTLNRFGHSVFQMSYTPGAWLTPTGLLKSIPFLRVWLAQGKGLSTVSLLCHGISRPLPLSDLWILEPGPAPKPAGVKDVPLIPINIRSGTGSSALKWLKPRIEIPSSSLPVWNLIKEINHWQSGSKRN